MLITLVPRLPPLVDGIGDYALSLAGVLRERVGIDTRFIVTDPSWPTQDVFSHFEVKRLNSHSASELLKTLECFEKVDKVLLHYEGYGYARRGCPFWLVNTLERWRNASGNRLLVTMFHELYASGPMWTSSFWLSPLQKKLTAKLADMSDRRVTSVELYKGLLAKLTGGTSSNTTNLPVFSSVGDPETIKPLQQRKRRIVVFGTRGRRLEVYRRAASDLNRLCRKLEIEEVVDIGRSTELDLRKVLNVSVREAGELTATDVSAICSDSIAGIIEYPLALLGKSTIFAAYCAHRMIPIVVGHGLSKTADGLRANVHFWPAQIADESINLELGRAIADRAFDWYGDHNLAIHARALASIFSHSALPSYY